MTESYIVNGHPAIKILSTFRITLCRLYMYVGKASLAYMRFSIITGFKVKMENMSVDVSSVKLFI